MIEKYDNIIIGAGLYITFEGASDVIIYNHIAGTCSGL